MSLKSACLELADDMEKEVNSCESTEACTMLRLYAKQLRMLCRAAGDDPQPPAFPATLRAGDQADMVFREGRWQKVAPGEREQKALKKAEEAEAAMESQMIIAEGGSLDGTFVPCDSRMPIGARTKLGGCVYRLDHEEVEGHGGHKRFVKKLIAEGG